MQENRDHACPSIGLLTETSWEVCNKIGGIYTVLSTKAKVLHDKFGDKLVFVGPDVWTDDNKSPYFIERKTLLGSAASKLKLPYGISIRVGRWNIPGSPVVMLVGFSGVYSQLDRIYGEMWRDFGVDSLHSYGDYAEGCAFAVASAIAISALAAHLKVDDGRVVAHFDEWTTAMGLLYLKAHSPRMATVFTTHATSIGRSICGNGKPLYDYFEGYDGDQMAGELNMESKHSLEKAAAHQADCFTTVSEVTARECAQLLDIKPQVVTPNGFEPGFVPGDAKWARLRRKGRDKLLRIASAMSGREFGDDTFIVATSGRNEYRNKGLDMYIDAVVASAGKLPADFGPVIALLLVPAWVSCPSGELLVDLNDKGDLRPSPAFLTHHLHNEGDDSICRRLNEVAGTAESGKVQIIYVPCYLDGHDGIVDISYYDLLPAIDLTVFPSYYEPWGYTPLESVAFGVPTISSDKAGFGQWALSHYGSAAASGVEVISRTDSNYSEDVVKLSGMIASAASSSAEERSRLREAARATAAAADWSIFIKHYYHAFDVALGNRDKRIQGK